MLGFFAPSASLTNLKPEWSSALESKLEVTVNIDASGQAEDISTFEYSSPAAVDAEEDNISIDIYGISALPPVTSKISDSSFTLKVSRGLITSDSEGVHLITVVLGDDVSRESTTHIIELTLLVNRAEPPPAAEAQGYYYSSSDYDYTYEETSYSYYFDYYQEVVEEQAMKSNSDEARDDTEPTGSLIEVTAVELAEQKRLEKAKADKKKERYRLKAKGFSRNPKIGFTWPGVDLEYLNSSQERASVIALEEEAIMGEPLSEPKIAISPIGADGSVSLDFNQDMVAPDTLLKPELYGRIFAMDITSGLDGTTIKGRFGEKKVGEARRRMLAEQGLDENDAAALLSFRIEVTEHTARKVKLKAVFDNPSAVSALAEDEFSFEVREPSLFKSASTLKALDKSAFGEGDGTIKKTSPPMISDVE